MQPAAKFTAGSPRSGRHFLQIPGPTNVPDRVLRAMDRPTIDHRGPEFARLATEIFDGLGAVFGTRSPVIVFPSSGTGAWEAAIVNTLRPGDRVLMFETGHFATLWKKMAERLGLAVDFVPGDWRRGVDPQVVETRLAEDRAGAVKAVMVVHNETSTGATSRIPLVRQAIDRARHGALLMVDTISALGSIDYRHAEWGVDVSVACSQKGLMLPPGLGMNAVSDKALAAARQGGMPRSYWDWEEMIKINKSGFFPYTPATGLLYGLREALAMLREEGLAAVFARHARHAEATRRAMRGWGLEILCAERHVEARRQGVPDRPRRRLQRSDADGDARRRRDGAHRRGRSAPGGRHPGGDGVPVRRAAASPRSRPAMKSRKRDRF